ncbi:NYN domain-containing protein [bacterium]|nr:NYN domain-containing protein [bacterium]
MSRRGNSTEQSSIGGCFFKGNMGKKKRAKHWVSNDIESGILLVDAYNVIHADAALKEALTISLELARDRLRGMCRYFRQKHRGLRVCLVFDGDSSVGYIPEKSREQVLSERDGISEIFTQTCIEADSRILQEVKRLSAKKQLIVVTADVDVIQECRVAGAEIMTPEKFIVECRATLKPKRKNRPTNPNSSAKKFVNPKQREDLIKEFEEFFGKEIDKPL